MWILTHWPAVQVSVHPHRKYYLLQNDLVTSYKSLVLRSIYLYFSNPSEYMLMCPMWYYYVVHALTVVPMQQSKSNKTTG